MKISNRLLAIVALVFGLTSPAAADRYAETIQLFKDAGESASFFDKSYGYAVFPTVGKAGLGIGGARGDGRVFKGGAHVGNTVLTQVSIGFQFGGQAYSQIIFFRDERAFSEFTSGNFEFGAQASAVVVTAAAGAGAGTTGAHAGASAGRKDAVTTGEFYKGVATFIIAKGGLMYEASIAGQKFSYRAVRQ